MELDRILERLSRTSSASSDGAYVAHVINNLPEVYKSLVNGKFGLTSSKQGTTILKETVLEVEQESEKPTQQSIDYDKEDENEWTKVDVKKKTMKAIGETIEKRKANENNDVIVEINEGHEMLGHVGEKCLRETSKLFGWKLGPITPFA